MTRPVDVERHPSRGSGAVLEQWSGVFVLTVWEVSVATTARATKRVLLLCGYYMEDYEAMVLFQALQAYWVSVDAVCLGKKAGDAYRTAVHQPTGHQVKDLHRLY